MVGRIIPEQEELKAGVLTKKAQNKSFFFTSDSYKQRVFVLDACNLQYYDGTIKKRGMLKGTITLRDVLAVENLQDKASPKCGFQVAYEEDGRSLILYVFAKKSQDRDDWVNAIREAALKSGAYFVVSYHPNCWDRQQGFSCCGAPSRGDEGCMLVTRHTAEMRERLLSQASSTNAGEVLVDMMNKRSQGKSFFFGAVNYKERVFVLDSHSLRYFSGNLKNREALKGSIELWTVQAVEQVSEQLLDNRKNAFQVVYADDNDQQMSLVIVARSGHKRQTWIQVLREEARKKGARFQPQYHPGVWVKVRGQFNCCHNINKHSLGCQPVTIDLSSLTSPSGNGQMEGGVEVVRDGVLMKRALNKSSFTLSSAFRSRLFVLNGQALTYFEAKGKRGEAKGRIALRCVEVVAPLQPGALEEYQYAFQVRYWDEEDQHRYFLYLAASSEDDRHLWLTDISAGVRRAGADLSAQYHSGVWSKWQGKFLCCGQLNREAQGCQLLDPPSPSLPPRSAQSHSSSSSSSLSSSMSSSIAG